MFFYSLKRMFNKQISKIKGRLYRLTNKGKTVQDKLLPDERYEYNDGVIYDNYTSKKYLSLNEIVDILNEQNAFIKKTLN